MNKKIQILAIAGAIMFSVFVLTSSDNETTIPLPKPNSYSENDSVIILAENLDKPRAIAVSDERIFVTEKDGYIRVIENNVLLESPLATFRTANVFDGGLLGIALHPNFLTNHFLYVFLFQSCSYHIVFVQILENLHILKQQMEEEIYQVHRKDI